MSVSLGPAITDHPSPGPFVPGTDPCVVPIEHATLSRAFRLWTTGMILSLGWGKTTKQQNPQGLAAMASLCRTETQEKLGHEGSWKRDDVGVRVPIRKMTEIQSSDFVSAREWHFSSTKSFPAERHRELSDILFLVSMVVPAAVSYPQPADLQNRTCRCTPVHPDPALFL